MTYFQEIQSELETTTKNYESARKTFYASRKSSIEIRNEAFELLQKATSSYYKVINKVKEYQRSIRSAKKAMEKDFGFSL